MNLIENAWVHDLRSCCDKSNMIHGISDSSRERGESMNLIIRTSIHQVHAFTDHGCQGAG